MCFGSQGFLKIGLLGLKITTLIRFVAKNTIMVNGMLLGTAFVYRVTLKGNAIFHKQVYNKDESAPKLLQYNAEKHSR